MTKPKTKKPLPAALSVEFNHQKELRTGTILEDRGLFWLVRDQDDEEYPVKKTSILRQWEPEPEPASPEHTVTSLLLGGTTPAPAPATPAAKDPDLVTLADLCAEYGIVGRIARRRLRSKFTQVGTGSRWEWKKTDPKLTEVRALLAPAPAPTVAQALDTLGMTQEDLDAGLASASAQGAAAADHDEE